MNDSHNSIVIVSQTLGFINYFCDYKPRYVVVARMDLFVFDSKQLRICVLQQLNVYPVPHELCQLCKDCRE